MKKSWYIGILIIALTLLGSVASKQQAAVPNQEIVLQFTSDVITSDEALDTIVLVKKQLQAVGVEHIQVQELLNGQLKITYYSDADVASIKTLLSNESTLELGYISKDNKQSNSPSEDHKIDYDLDVYEIQQSNDLSDLDGKLALETKTEHERFFNPNVLIAPEEISIDTKENIENVAYKFRRTIAIAIDNNSYKIPEVRAGPDFNGIDDLS
nr:hypothetical protein [uncultured Psychroserpens sp.]